MYQVVINKQFSFLWGTKNTSSLKEMELPSVDGHVIQTHSTGEPLEQHLFQGIPHKQNPLAGQTCLSE